MPRRALLTLLLALAMPLAVADDPARNPKLVGRWRYRGADATAMLTLSADGTWSATVAVSGEPETRFGGKWLSDEHYIYWLYTKSSTPQVQPGTQDRDELVEVARDHFKLQTRSKARRTYVRVK
jgi:hypothetical protein